MFTQHWPQMNATTCFDYLKAVVQGVVSFLAFGIDMRYFGIDSYHSCDASTDLASKELEISYGL